MAIVFDRFWKLVEERGISQYALISKYKISASTINKLKHNENIETKTLDKICKALNCQLEDIAEYIED